MVTNNGISSSGCLLGDMDGASLSWYVGSTEGWWEGASVVGRLVCGIGIATLKVVEAGSHFEVGLGVGRRIVKEAEDAVTGLVGL